MGLTTVKSLSNIDGVVIEPLKEIVDDRGAVLHMLRCDSPLFTKFGEIYFSLILPGVVKAWKRHQRMTQRLAVPVGMIRLVLYDDRNSSPGQGRLEEYILGRPNHYCLLQIPPMIWYGFQGLESVPSLVANCADLPHSPDEVENLPITSYTFPYNWVQP
jgi:dTDP-4-dehydrorhamnose 3,5-epimerase